MLCDNWVLDRTNSKTRPRSKLRIEGVFHPALELVSWYLSLNVNFLNIFFSDLFSHVIPFPLLRNPPFPLKIQSLGRYLALIYQGTHLAFTRCTVDIWEVLFRQEGKLIAGPACCWSDPLGFHIFVISPGTSRHSPKLPIPIRGHSLLFLSLPASWYGR